VFFFAGRVTDPPLPRTAGVEPWGINPITANLMRGFDGRTPDFVPEGQAESSQARSAWVAMQSGPRPGGTVEGIVMARSGLKSLAQGLPGFTLGSSPIPN
jgi:hypothetical protein